MPQRNRRGSQLALEIPPEMLQRLKGYAATQQRPVASVVRLWIEQGLGGGLGNEPLPPVIPSGLEQRLAALEAAVAAMQRPLPPTPASQPQALAERPSQPARAPLTLVAPPPPPPPEGAAAPPSSEAFIPRSGEALTTVELAAQTNTNKGAWNNWAGQHAVGDVRHHPEAGSWRLVGKASLESGGPSRWLWERCP